MFIVFRMRKREHLSKLHIASEPVLPDIFHWLKLNIFICTEWHEFDRKMCKFLPLLPTGCKLPLPTQIL
uniref:Uncharacterized protein n=1 Tax=Arion vulgaris TaxID=1028688 RepID=A0A0B6ZML6_9EUPU